MMRPLLRPGQKNKLGSIVPQVKYAGLDIQLSQKNKASHRLSNIGLSVAFVLLRLICLQRKTVIFFFIN